MSKRRSKKKKGVGCIVIIIILVAAVLVGGGIWKSGLGKAYEPGNSETVAVNIPSGSSTIGIGRILEDQGIVGSAKDFKYFVKFNGYDGKLQAGDYELSPSMTKDEIVQALLSGKNLTKRFTIPEGYSAAQIAGKLADSGLGDYNVFCDEIQNGNFDYPFIDMLGDTSLGWRLEGTLFPETYDVYVDASEHEILDRMLKQFNVTFTDEYYARMNELGLSLKDTLTIASIIEREAKIDSDRPLISSVIYNRLNIGMKLQMCSTVQYILGEPKERLTYNDIAIDNPYNTYKNAGLPPGPICSPGKASIEAALWPADTDYIYFVVSEKLDGSHAFSSNAKQFEKDKAAYQQALKNQN